MHGSKALAMISTVTFAFDAGLVVSRSISTDMFTTFYEEPWSRLEPERFHR